MLSGTGVTRRMRIQRQIGALVGFATLAASIPSSTANIPKAKGLDILRDRISEVIDSRYATNTIPPVITEIPKGQALKVALSQVDPGTLEPTLYFSNENLGVAGAQVEGDAAADFYDPLRGIVFLKLSYYKGDWIVQDTSPNGMDPATKDWLLARIAESADILTAAAEKGKLTEITFAYSNDPENPAPTDTGIASFGLDGGYTEYNSIILRITQFTKSIDAQQFISLLTHEAAHVLLTFIEDEANKKIRKKLLV